VASSLAAVHTGIGAQTDRGSAKLHEDAVRRMGDGDLAGAVIQLKNALDINPNYLPSRLLLGRAYLRLGQGAAAETALRQALALGANKDVIVAPLGNALLLQRKHEEILDTLQPESPDPKDDYEIYTIRGRAHLEQGRLSDAELSFEFAMSLDAERPEAILGLASVFLARGQIDEAADLVDRVRVGDPDSPEVWFRDGEVRHAAGDMEAALESYGVALEKNPNHMRARVARAVAHLALERYDLARSDAEVVLGVSPNNIRALVILGQALVLSGDRRGANEAFVAADARVSLLSEASLMKDPGRLHVAATLSYLRGNLEKAHRYLESYLALRPQNLATRKLLGRVKLDLGQNEEAILILHPALRSNRADSETLMLLGDAYSRVGHFVEAADVFERAAALVPDSASVRTQLGMSRIGAGRTEEGIAELRRAIGLDAGTNRAAMVLALLHIRRGEYEEALQTGRSLEERSPEDPAVHNLMGSAYMSAGDPVAARRAYETALEFDAGFHPAHLNLAILDLGRGDREGARAHYLAVVEKDPRHSRALIGLSDLAFAEGRGDEALRWLERAGNANPDLIAPQLKVVEVHLRQGNKAHALRLADRLYGRHTERADVLELFARALAENGDRRRARTILRRAVRFADYDGGILLRIAASQVRLQDNEGAYETLKRASNTTVAEDAEVALIRLDLLTGALDDALSRATRLRGSTPDDTIGDLLVGEVLSRMERHAEAAGAFEAGLEKSPSAELTLGLYRARSATGSTPEALELLERWLENHPSDTAIRRALASGYIAAQKLDEAQVLYGRLVEEQPGNAELHSNLARLYQLRGDARARAHAERAYELAPAWATALDTLGWLLVTQGEPAKALPLLREARSRVTQKDWLVRYHLAVALVALGRTVEARRELEGILGSAGNPDALEQVRALYEKLSSG
jgi:putative PEP-CTERM system TPR-repeat lipoprotein